MKKYLFFALALAGMLSSCSNDDIVSGGSDDYRTNESLPVPIKIGFGNIAKVTRGTGTVGSTNATTSNEWKGQKVNIYMLNKDTVNNDSLRLAKDQYGIIYRDSVFVTPIGVDEGVAEFENNHIKYYPAQGNFDFYGYRLDDAVATFASDFNANGAAKDSISIDFEINGSQDIMVAKADTTGVIVNDKDSVKAKERAYSAYSARHGLQPTLAFKHLLTRLAFNVIPGDSAVTKAGAAVSIDSIMIKTVNKGRLIVAKRIDLPGKQQYIEWGTGGAGTILPADSAELWLMQRDTLTTPVATTEADPLIKLRSVSLEGRDSIGTVEAGKWYPVITPIGEALLVQPGVDKYYMEVYMSQEVPTNTDPLNPEPRKWENVYKTPISPATTPFAEGTSYNVNITVWGLEEIIVTTKLTKWEDGGTISINGEDLGF